MSLKVKLMDDFKKSMKEKDVVKKRTITLVRGDIKQKEVDTREELNDEQILDIIAKQVKQRRDSIEEFKKGDRQDLVEESQLEIAVLMGYHPEQLSEEEVRKVVLSVIEEVGATSPKDIGKVMPQVIAKTKGKADGKMISKLVKEMLNK